jgi:PAS domain S-box-containing protein
MQEVAVAANEADTLEQAAGLAMRQISTHVGCAIGHLCVSPADTEAPAHSLWHLAGEGDYRAFQEASDNPSSLADDDFWARVSATGRPVWIADLEADSQWPRREQALAAGLESGFAFPVFVGPEIVAVLEFFSRTRMESTGSFLDVLTGIGTQLGRVVERQRAATALRRSAEELRVSEARLREAQALARLGSWYYDLRTGESTWSEEMCCLYGLEPGAPAVDLEAALASVHPADRARAGAALSRLVESGERVSEDVRVVRPDGQLRWYRSEGSVVKDQDGQVVAIHGTSQDITDRKLMEEALRERERQLSEAQRAARLGSWERDLSTGRMTWSDEMYRLWGWEPSREISLEVFLATLPDDDRQRLVAEAARVHRTGESICLDFRASVADGRQRWFRGGAQLLHDEAGRPIRVVGTAQDITEEKQAEEELRAAKDLYQRIVETAYEGVLTVDAQDITTFANARMAQILGYSAEQMPGMPVSAFVDEETLASLSVHRQRRRAGISEHYASTLRAKDGAAVPVLISASPFFGDDGRYAGTLAMVTDVSAFAEADEVLRLHGLRVHPDGGAILDKPPAS